jgi:outer membrane cobalamin receptor
LSLTHQYSRVLEAILSGNEGKSLLYRPDWNAVHTLTYDTPKIDFQLRTNYLGKRQTLRDNSSSGELSREVWADLSCASTVLSKVKILFAVHNITNADRTFFLNYPMPGRHYSLTIQIHSK